jgi:hypothetical protein
MMLMSAVGRRDPRGVAWGRRRGRFALMALIAIGSFACQGGPSTTVPAMPGAIVVTTATTGFMQDTSYDLLVNGQSVGAIGANDQITVPDLDPATYEVDLGDLADNCAVQGDSVTVAAADTASAQLSIVCTFAPPTSYTIRFEVDRPDLETGQLASCPFGFCSTTDAWDIWAYNNSSTTPHSVIRQNQTNNVEIAHLPGVTLDSLTEEDYQNATFTTDLVSDPFDAGRVILIRTDMGNVYALGNPVEDMTAGTLTFDAALIVPAH